MKWMIGVALLAVMLTGCGSEADIPAMETEIEQGILDQADLEVDVDGEPFFRRAWSESIERRLV